MSLDPGSKRESATPESVAAHRLDPEDFVQKLVVPNSRLHWLIGQADDAERMGQVEMTLEELRAVLTELAVRRG